MKKLLYKHLLKPKNERTPLTPNEITTLSAIGGLTMIIMTMIIGHYFVEMYKYDKLSKISDSCRVRYMLSDGSMYMCKSYLFDDTYYTIDTDEIPSQSNIYIHRKLHINDDGTINYGTFNYDLRYTAK